MGFPSPAADYVQEPINLQDALIKHPVSTFFFRNKTDAMINALIGHEALLVVDRSVEAKNGDIIIAFLQGEFYVRYLKKNMHKCWICPANSKYREQEVTHEMGMLIWGVVIYVINDPKKLKHVRISGL